MTQPLRLLPGGVPLEVVRGEPFAVVASFVDAAGDPLPLGEPSFAAELLDRDAVPLAGGAMTVAAVGEASLRVEAPAAAAALLVDSLHRWRLVDVSSGHTGLDGPVRPRPSGAAGVAAASFEVTAVLSMAEAAVTVSVMTTGSSGGGGGGADLSDATPAPLGVAAAGAGAKASREDHVHAMPTAADVGALSASSGFNTAGGWLRLDASGTAPDNTIPSSIARDTEVTAAVAAHTTAVDPHGDRAYADDLAGMVMSLAVQAALGVGTTQVLVTDPNGSAITTGDGKAYVTVPAAWNGLSILSVHCGLTTASSSGTPTVQLARTRSGSTVDVLSTAVTIDANELTSYTAATPPVVNESNDDLATGDLLRVDIDVAGTGAKGLMVLIAVA